MSSFATIVQNPLTAERDSRDREALRRLFPELEAVDDDRLLVLRPYLEELPERFFDRPTYRHLLAWLQARDTAQRDKLQKYLAAADTDLTLALLFLRETNAASWHDEIEESGEEFDLVRFIDRILNPAYLRLVEGVLIPQDRHQPGRHPSLAPEPPQRPQSRGEGLLCKIVRVVRTHHRMRQAVHPFIVPVHEDAQGSSVARAALLQKEGFFLGENRLVLARIHPGHPTAPYRREASRNHTNHLRNIGSKRDKKVRKIHPQRGVRSV